MKVSIRHFLTKAITAAVAILVAPFTWAVDYNSTARAYAQVIAAGVSPSQVDWYDSTFDVVAIVRPGMAPLYQVSFQDTGGFLSMLMNRVGVLSNGDEVYQFTYSIQPGSMGNTTFSTAWGPNPGQYNIIAIGADQIRCEDDVRPVGGGNDKNVGCHTFPYLRVDYLQAVNDVPRPPGTIKPQEPVTYNSTKRYAPQVVMAGYSPAILHIGDDQFDLISVVRPGVLPIESVTLKHNSNAAFAYTMTPAGELSNGDLVYKTTYVYPRGAFGVPPEGMYLSYKDLWGPHAEQFGIVVYDQGGLRSHKFPDIQFGTYPDPDNPR